jgi:hypothetical protein
MENALNKSRRSMNPQITEFSNLPKGSFPQPEMGLPFLHDDCLSLDGFAWLAKLVE